jgi:hypothetical protein
MDYLLEFALRSVAAEHSDSPIYLVFPAWRISASAGIDSWRGVSVLLSLTNNDPFWV